MNESKIAAAVLMEAINRALPAQQIKAIQQQQIVAAEEEMDRLEASGLPPGKLEAVRLLLEEQRLRLSEIRRNAPE